jgi:hypothetical protein
MLVLLLLIAAHNYAVWLRKKLLSRLRVESHRGLDNAGDSCSSRVVTALLSSLALGSLLLNLWLDRDRSTATITLIRGLSMILWDTSHGQLWKPSKCSFSEKKYLLRRLHWILLHDQLLELLKTLRVLKLVTSNIVIPGEVQILNNLDSVRYNRRFISKWLRTLLGRHISDHDLCIGSESIYLILRWTTTRWKPSASRAISRTYGLVLSVLRHSCGRIMNIIRRNRGGCISPIAVTTVLRADRSNSTSPLIVGKRFILLVSTVHLVSELWGRDISIVNSSAAYCGLNSL